MKRFFILTVFLLVFGCGTKTESDKVVEIIYPSDSTEVPEDFYVLATSMVKFIRKEKKQNIIFSNYIYLKENIG